MIGFLEGSGNCKKDCRFDLLQIRKQPIGPLCEDLLPANGIDGHRFHFPENMRKGQKRQNDFFFGVDVLSKYLDAITDHAH